MFQKKINVQNVQNVQKDNRDQYFKIKLCPFHIKGVCKKGDECSFAHDESDIRVGISLKKTRMCHAWQNGNCNQRDCRFAHGEGELRSTPDYYKTSMCRYWLKGDCPQKESCRHAHGMHELRERSYRHSNEEKKKIVKEKVEIVEKPEKKFHRSLSQSTSTSYANNLKVQNRQRRLSMQMPPPGLEQPDLIEYYDGTQGQHVLLPPTAYVSPKSYSTTGDQCKLQITHDSKSTTIVTTSSDSPSTEHITEHSSWSANPHLADEETFVTGDFNMLKDSELNLSTELKFVDLIKMDRDDIFRPQYNLGDSFDLPISPSQDETLATIAAALSALLN